MDSKEMVDLCLKHTLYSWSATGSVNPIPIDRAEGVYFYSPEGKRWLDFNSQLMSVNIGHQHPKVVKAIQDQAAKLCFAGPGAATEIRAKLAKRLAELVPGDINTFFFTLGGAEANENAIRAAKLFTGRPKIIARHRSYHGGTNAAMQLTGDPRRWANEPGMPGVVRVMDPFPYNFSWGTTDEQITSNNLAYLEEVIKTEGPNSIAAMIIETVVGTNGILVPPKGYLKGLKALLDKYGILLICDEVMAGFGRTGKLFAFQHGDIVPDIVTMAKGLTSSYMPLGCMGVSDKIADHFRKNTYWGGLTYNAHPMGLAASYAAIEVLIDEGMIENAARLEPILRGHMERMQAKHPSVRTHRNIGLFGIIETKFTEFNKVHPPVAEMGKFFVANGLYTTLQWGSVMCNPPLCITDAQLAEGFAIIDEGLGILDRALT